MRLLVGVDGSDRGMQALDEAVEQARAPGNDLTVAVYGDGGRAAAVESRVSERLSELGVDAAVERLDDDAGGLLVDLAERGGYDRIVLPGGQRSPLGKIQFDSTVEFVLLNARTTVTLVR